MDALFHLSGLLSPLYATVLNFFTGHENCFEKKNEKCNILFKN
jgi:hypothetical protein